MLQAPDPMAAAAELLDPPDDPFADATVPPREFISQCRIVPAEGGRPIPFRLWGFQDDVLDDITSGEWLIFLKARQLGITWLVLAYALWLACCRPYRTILIVNQNLREATKLLNRVRLMHQHLPDALRTHIVTDRFDELGFVNGSRIISLPATPDAGSGETAHLVLLDEWAKLPFAETIFTAITGTLAAGGQLIGVSTAKGYGNLFARTWKAALSGLNAFRWIFIPTTAHPLRDEAWRDEERKKYDTERAFLQEHPERWQDAFQQAGESVFEEFDRSVHHRAGRDPKAGWPVWRGTDFGHHLGIAIYFELQAKRHIHIFDEVPVARGTTEDLAIAMNAADTQHGATSNRNVGADPAGVAQTSASTKSDHDVLRTYGYRVAAREDQQRVAPKERVGLIKRLLGPLVRDDDGRVIGRREVRLTIDTERCPILAAALEQAVWVKHRGPEGQAVQGETYPKDGRYEHPLDALGYGLVNALPLGGPPAAASSPAPAAGYSSSQYG